MKGVQTDLHTIWKSDIHVKVGRKITKEKTVRHDVSPSKVFQSNVKY